MPRGKPPWAPRHGHEAVVFRDRLLVLGGFSGRWLPQHASDVWASADGERWAQLAEAAWPARLDSAVAVWRNQLYVLGGVDRWGFPLQDVWTTIDGRQWDEEPTPPWCARASHRAVAFLVRNVVLGQVMQLLRQLVLSLEQRQHRFHLLFLAACSTFLERIDCED